jgi:hypothetical protein
LTAEEEFRIHPSDEGGYPQRLTVITAATSFATRLSSCSAMPQGRREDLRFIRSIEPKVKDMPSLLNKNNLKTFGLLSLLTGGLVTAGAALGGRSGLLLGTFLGL